MERKGRIKDNNVITIQGHMDTYKIKYHVKSRLVTNLYTLDHVYIHSCAFTNKIGSTFTREVGNNFLSF